MADEQGETMEGGEAAAPVEEQRIMCFVSKQMVPISQTVEIEYMPHKKVRVMPQFVRYADPALEALGSETES